MRLIAADTMDPPVLSTTPRAPTTPSCAGSSAATAANENNAERSFARSASSLKPFCRSARVFFPVVRVLMGAPLTSRGPYRESSTERDRDNASGRGASGLVNVGASTVTSTVSTFFTFSRAPLRGAAGQAAAFGPPWPYGLRPSGRRPRPGRLPNSDARRTQTTTPLRTRVSALGTRIAAAWPLVGLPARRRAAAQAPNIITEGAERAEGAQPQRRLPASTPSSLPTPWDGRYSLTQNASQAHQRRPDPQGQETPVSSHVHPPADDAAPPVRRSRYASTPPPVRQGLARPPRPEPRAAPQPTSTAPSRQSSPDATAAPRRRPRPRSPAGRDTGRSCPDTADLHTPGAEGQPSRRARRDGPARCAACRHLVEQ
ncbi:MAG: hypothetical protein QOD83_3702 [Solirubrobacteraceae bacterium]|nr:hypothetical protein [Solirubrobacteraceae bacterium]